MPTIAVFGATGSAVLEAVLADGRYTPRAVSRNLNSAASKALIARGVEVVAADLSDKDSLVKAIRGSEAVFGITNFFDPEVWPADPQGKGEIAQGKNLVDAAKELGVKFFIWSSLPSFTALSNGRYTHVYHVDNKAAILQYLKASGVPHAVLMGAWFGENLWKIGALQQTETGYTIPIPNFGSDLVQAFTWAARDMGQSALALLTHYQDPSKSILGKAYPVVSFRCTYPELAAAIAAGLGQEVTFTSPPTSGLAEIDEMYLFEAEFGMYTDTPVPNPELVALGVKFGTLEEFVRDEVVPHYASQLL
ncbi:NAD(P)-binding protein [Mycena filopes]|nr:NAD(P)-binding protein [Mycena filopes]